MIRHQCIQPSDEMKIRPYFSSSDGARNLTLITDATVPDFPIIYASPTFELETGYRFEEIQGRNCRFLQGPGTDPRTIQAIRLALERRSDITVDILNYRKDGSPIWFRLHLSPLWNRHGRLMAYIGTQTPITAEQAGVTALGA